MSLDWLMLCAHTHVSILMCTCVQADGYFPDSNEASCYPHSLWVPSPCSLPAPAQPSITAQLDMTGTILGNGWRRSLPVPSMPFRDPHKAMSYKQVRAGQTEGLDVGERTDRQRDSILVPSPERLYSALLCPTGSSDLGLERGISAKEKCV